MRTAELGINAPNFPKLPPPPGPPRVRRLKPDGSVGEDLELMLVSVVGEALDFVPVDAIVNAHLDGRVPPQVCRDACIAILCRESSLPGSHFPPLVGTQSPQLSTEYLSATTGWG